MRVYAVLGETAVLGAWPPHARDRAGGRRHATSQAGGQRRGVGAYAGRVMCYAERVLCLLRGACCALRGEACAVRGEARAVLFGARAMPCGASRVLFSAGRGVWCALAAQHMPVRGGAGGACLVQVRGEARAVLHRRRCRHPRSLRGSAVDSARWPLACAAKQPLGRLSECACECENAKVAEHAVPASASASASARGQAATRQAESVHASAHANANMPRASACCASHAPCVKR